LDLSFKLVPSPVVSSAGLIYGVPRLKGLLRLNLSYLEHVTDAVVDAVRSTRALRNIRLEGC